MASRSVDLERSGKNMFGTRPVIQRPHKRFKVKSRSKDRKRFGRSAGHSKANSSTRPMRGGYRI